MNDAKSHRKEHRAVVVIGAGEHGRVAVDALRAGRRAVLGYLDDNVPPGQQDDGISVLGPLSLLDGASLRDAELFVAIGDNDVRCRTAQILRQKGRLLCTVVHPFCWISSQAYIGSNVIIMAGVTVNVGARIEDDVIVNTGATVDHDCILEQGAHVCPGVHLAGRVRVGAMAFLGTGASATPGVVIGERCVLGAGAVAVSDLPAGVTAVGVPARVVRQRS